MRRARANLTLIGRSVRSPGREQRVAAPDPGGVIIRWPTRGNGVVRLRFEHQAGRCHGFGPGGVPGVIEDRLDRLTRMTLAVQAVQGADPARDLCEACVSLLSVSGASMTVVTEGVASVLSASNAIASRLEELQVTLGEGPSIDAHETGRPVAEPNLDRPRRERWIAFAPAARETGARALFAFPLRLGGVRLGALTLYEDEAGDLSDDQHSDAIAVSNLATTAILTIQSESFTDGLSPHLEMLAVNNAVLHQASGMASVQLGVGVGEALVRIRAHAFAAQRSLGDVTKDIVSRRLRLEP